MEEIKFDKYEKMGAYHWKEFHKDTAYRKNALFIQKWVGEGNILDVGAGDGLITSLLNAKGIDNSERAVELAKNKGVNVIYASSDSLPFKDKSFDKVLLADVIEHIQYPFDTIIEILRVLVDGGFLYIVTPPKGGRMDKYHYKEYDPTELVDYMSEFGLELVDDVIVHPELNRMYAKFKL